MNIPLVVASVVLSGAALFDGWTTVRFLKNPDYYEADTAWLFGPRPSTLKVYGLGTLVIAGEVAVGLLANRFSVYAGYVMAAGFAFQAGYAHIREAIRNLKIPV
jgi:hypothetical protein